LAGQPNLAIFRDIRTYTNTVTAPRDSNLKPCLLIHLVEACLSQHIYNRPATRHDLALSLSDRYFASFQTLLQYQGAHDYVFLGSGAGTNETTVEIRAIHLTDGYDIIRVRVTRDKRLGLG
jgi:hypothetical protein